MKKEYLILLSAGLIIGVIAWLSTLVLPGSHGSTQADHQSHEHQEITSERAFLEHMIPHHAEAVVLAEELLQETSVSEPSRIIAEAIVFGQAKEIGQMKDWYRDWYDEDYADSRQYKPMMRELAGLPTREREQTFLVDMIAHHEAAVVAAEKVLALSPGPEVQKMAENILATQQIEIEMMTEILATLR